MPSPCGAMTTTETYPVASHSVRSTKWWDRQMLNKGPEITLYFWIIKILCTTVGESGADYLNDTLGFGLYNTTYVTGGLLLMVLFFQFRARRYVPGIYWLGVVLISVFGT